MDLIWSAVNSEVACSASSCSTSAAGHLSVKPILAVWLMAAHVLGLSAHFDITKLRVDLNSEAF